MNALTLSTPVSPIVAGPAGDGTAPVAAIMADGQQPQDSEIARFSELFEMLVVPPMLTLPATPVAAEEATLPVAGSGKTLPVALPVMRKAATSAEAAPAGIVDEVPAAAAGGHAMPEGLPATAPAMKPMPKTLAANGRILADETAAEAVPAALPPPRMIAAKADTIEPPARHVMPNGAAAVQVEPEAEPDAPVDMPQRTEAAPAARILLAQNGAEMQVQFLSPSIPDAKASAATAAVAAPADRIDVFQGSQRLEELVQAIAHARESGTAQPVRATISHAEFGMLALKLTREDGGVSAQIASGDASFAPAAHAALRIAAEAGLQGQPRGDEQPRHHGPAAEQAQTQASTQTGTQAGTQSHAQAGGQQGFAGGRQQPRADAQSGQPAQADDGSDRHRPQGRSAGLYA